MNSEKEWLVGIHVSQLLGFIIPLGGILVPLAIWLVKREENRIIDSQGRDILNFQISYLALSTLLMGISLFLGPMTGEASMVHVPALGAAATFSILLWGVGIGVPILGAHRATQGKEFRYPALIRVLH